MLKNPKLQETVDKMIKYRKENKGSNTNNNDKEERLVSKMELGAQIFESLFKDRNNKNYNNDDHDDESKTNSDDTTVKASKQRNYRIYENNIYLYAKKRSVFNVYKLYT